LALDDLFMGTRGMDQDSEVIARLRELGANLSLPREVLHYLHLPTREAAEAVAGQLPDLGYRAQILQPDPAAQWDNPWTVIAAGEMVLTEDSIDAARLALERLLATVDGEYDGWEAAAEP
jgi:hypothetical protein